mgnify:CR=1 FL=1|jgi:hypothetical protein
MSKEIKRLKKPVKINRKIYSENKPNLKPNLRTRIKMTIIFYSSLIGLTISLGSFFTVFTTFMVAYNTPEKKVIVDINSVGEANLEYKLLLFSTPFVIFFGIYSLILLIREKNRVKSAIRTKVGEINQNNSSYHFSPNEKLIGGR